MPPTPELPMPVWRVLIAVRPLPSHPAFWSVQCGALAVWLIAKDAGEAQAKAETIVAATGLYEQQTAQPVFVASEEQAEALACKEPHVLAEGLHATPIVRTAGLAFFFHFVQIGQDEKAFFDAKAA